MALREILKNNESVLFMKTKPVTEINDRILTLLDDMADTLYKADGVGLAAPQIGILRRICIIDVGDGLVEMINPEVLETSGEQGGMEGCLSFPGQAGYVVRPNRVKARALNRKGEMVEYEAEGLFARAIMHETDHLDGNVFLRLVTEPPEGYEEGEEEEE